MMMMMIAMKDQKKQEQCENHTQSKSKAGLLT